MSLKTRIARVEQSLEGTHCPLCGADRRPSAERVEADRLWAEAIVERVMRENRLDRAGAMGWMRERTPQVLQLLEVSSHL